MEILNKINSSFFSIEKAYILSRVFMALMFIESATNHIINYQHVLEDLKALGLPFTSLLLLSSIICEIIGVFALLSGLLYKIGLLILIMFTITSSLMFFPFWSVEGIEASIFLQQFVKNLAITGALLLMHSIGSRINIRNY